MNKTLLNKIWAFLRNKFFLTLAIFIVWLIVFDQHNLIDRYKAHRHLNKLKKDTTYYINKIEQDRMSIRLLETDKENLEKFARERYLMKAPDEDVYIIVKD
ncbi:MAG: septum formation initiator family protein [Bacteroidota bacterium]|nr:septum formation initiator family protein [Bacteroidota bacterium]